MPLRRIAIVVLVAAVATAAAACDTVHVTLKAGDCVNAALAAIACADAAARFRVVDVVRTEGAHASCAPTLSSATFTEGGDGPMIGLTVCLAPLAGAAPS